MLAKRGSRCAASLLAAFVLVCSAPVQGLFCGDRVLDPGEECDDGNNFGGDGCASNCTPESVRRFVLDPEESFAQTQLIAFAVEFSLRGEILFTTGRPSEDGFIPFVLRAGDVDIERVSVPGLTCACPIVAENAELYGPGNAGFGGIECGDGIPAPDRLFVVPQSVSLLHDHNTDDVDPLCEQGEREAEGDLHPGACNGPLTLAPQGMGGHGSAVVVNNLTLRLIRDGGLCTIDPSDPRKGPDGIPCNADDPSGEDDTAQVVVIDPAGAFTGAIEGTVRDANNVLGADIAAGELCGGSPCEVGAEGELLDCDELLDGPAAPITRGAVALAFPILDARGIGDSVVTVKLVPMAPPVECAGDCDGDGAVTIAELVRGVNIALGSLAVEGCPAFDTDGDGVVSINELVTAVGAALGGCG